MSAQVGGTLEVYHEAAARRSIYLGNTFCARCESVGHVADVCPFPDDAETRRRAEARRERRSHPKPRLARPVDNEPLPPTGLSDVEMRALLTRLSGGKWQRRTLSHRSRLYHALAYYRMKLGRVRAKRSSYSEHWVAFYRDECERLRRCIETKPRGTGKVVYPEMRAEVRSWLKESEVMPW